jgi:hypothetical protein
VSRDATLYIDDMIEACRRVMQYKRHRALSDAADAFKPARIF